MANRRINQNSSSGSSSDDFNNYTYLKSPTLDDDLKSREILECSKDSSLTCHDVGYLRKVLELHFECDLRIPESGEDCHNPPSGYFTVFLEYFNSGLSFPPQPFLLELVKNLGVSFSQLTPNAIIVFSAFCHKMTEIQMPLGVELFHSLFQACRSRPDSYVYFQPRKNCKFLSRIPSPKSFWRSQFFYIRDCGWEVPVVWSSGLNVIALREVHRTLQLQCSALGLFTDLFDPRSLLFNGSRIDLASVRARRDTLGRRSPPAGNSRVPVARVPYTSRDLVRRDASSVRTESARGAELHDPKKAGSSLSNKDSDSRAAKGDGREAGKRVHDEARKRTEEQEARQSKKSRVEDLEAPSKPSLAKHIFVDGVNRKEKAGSFWDLDDPEIGSKTGRGIVGDFDMLYLLSLPTDSFANALSWNSCQGLSLASAVRVREERLRNEKDKLSEEVHRLKDENRLLSEEKKKKDAELLQAQKDLAGKVADFVVLEEKYVLEKKTGGHFLESEAGKAFTKNVEEKGVQSFKTSSVFHDEVLDQDVTIHDDVVLACRDQLRKNGVSEEIVMMIEPSVLEANAISTDDIPLGDDEMIEALK